MMTQAAASNRRRYGRKESLRELSVVWHRGGKKFISRVRDLSLGGAFLEVADPPPQGTTLTLVFPISGKVARARAIVCRSLPGEGMGIEFVAMGQEDRACLAVAAESAHELIPVADKPQPQAPASSAINPTQTLEAERRQKTRRAPVERRAHPRHKVTAQIQLAEADSGKHINARMGNLSAGGCFFELETDSSFSLGTTVKVTISKGAESFQSEAIVVYLLPPKGVGVTFAATEPEHLRILEAWMMETSWLAADRRKGQRIVLGVPVRVMGRNASGTSFTEEMQTLKVSADGCSLPLAAPVNKGQYVTLLNLRTKGLMECVIVRIEQSSDARREIGMAFLLPNTKFWQLTFPPLDKSSDHLEAEQRQSQTEELLPLDAT